MISNIPRDVRDVCKVYREVNVPNIRDVRDVLSLQGQEAVELITYLIRYVNLLKKVHEKVPNNVPKSIVLMVLFTGPISEPKNV